MSTVHAVVAGGGTAGHVLPALAVAEALVASGHDPARIHLVGTTRGIETELVPKTPFPHTFLDVVGFQRRLSRRNLAFAPKMVAATRRMRRSFAVDRPTVVVSVGGYASMPAVFAAWRLSIPVVVVSYDHTPGWASRLAAKRAAACAVAFDDSPLPGATVTGAPVRQAILDVDRRADRGAARQRLGVAEDRFLVAVMGGSQGSGVLNDVIGRYAAAHRDDAGLAIRHVVGERFLADVPATRPDGEGIQHDVVGYEPDMAAVYAAADLLIGRGGASTVHEVAVTGMPAVLVPWKDSAGDHQTANVEWLATAGAAVHLDEHHVERLPDTIESLRRDEDERARLATAASELGARHRSGDLAALIDRAAVASDAS